MLVGCLFVALSVMLLRQANLLTGGTAGLAFIVYYLSNLPFGLVYFVINLPFYLFAWRALGWVFTLKTFTAISLLSIYTEWLPQLMQLNQLNPVFAAVAGGFLAGAGLLMLVRHRASLGGVGVLAIYLQEKYGWRAGHIQMAADVMILIGSLLLLDVRSVALSVLAAAAVNVVITVNHKPGRYVGI
ncbi:hypothetical protein CSQ89_20140 [Chitinimonas sp. BJB300]|nr:hypothetical protein CSQ89_20140 [Chitinimonas sp. BJB300]TSJ90203.1 YitT family protein [Chitinimonas sp. BJB300]